MKKLISGLIAALMMAAALVAFSGSAANAACPYGGCFPTFTHIHAPAKVKAGHRARVCVNVTSDGNGTPKGHVTVRLTKRNGADRYISTHRYTGGRECFHSTKLHRGKYSILAAFDRKPGSRWNDSDQRGSLRVTRR